MPNIILNKEIFAQEPIITHEVYYEKIVDDSTLKTVSTEIRLGKLPNGGYIWRILVLWEGEEYDAIGQWTDAQAEARIKEILES
jgi:hypothetical protein